jgi:hypothetical protein
MLSNVKLSAGARLSLKILGWLLVGITILLAGLCVISLAVILNRAPFNQLVAIWINVTITYFVFLTICIVASLIYYPKGTVEENATPTTYESAEGDDVSPLATSPKPSARLAITAPSQINSNQPSENRSTILTICTRKEVISINLSFIVVAVSVIIGTAFIFPEAYNNTAKLRIQKLGSLSSNSATIFLRDSFSANLTHVLNYRLANKTAEWNQTSFSVDPAKDFTAFVQLSGLSPSTSYSYYLDKDDTNQFNFTTSPLEGNPAAFSFYFGSCFLNNVPNFMPASGWRNIDRLLSKRQSISPFILFIGDFIYSDHPWYKGSSINDYSCTFVL